MAETLDGLFGPTPQQIQQAQQQQLAQNAAQFAKMSPFEKAGMLTYQGAGGLVNAVAPQFGGVNIAQQQAAKQQEIMGAQGTDLSTSEGTLAVADRFRQAGDLNTAMKLTLRAQEMKKQEAAAALAARKQDFAETQDFQLRQEKVKADIEARKTQLEQQAAAAQQRSEDLRYSADQRAEAAKYAADARAQIAQMTFALKQVVES